MLFVAIAESSAPEDPSDAELAAISERGRQLAEYDGAAWQATDALMAARPAEDRLGSYVARKTEAGWAVAFGRLDEAGEKFLVTYEAVSKGKKAKFEVKGFDPPREDTGWNLATARGIQTARKDFGPLSRPYNHAVLAAEQGELYVYLYPAQTKEDVYPLGGDVRYRVSPDGTRIIDKRQMHKTIIEMTTRQKGVKTEHGWHTHVLSVLPEDTDVLMVLIRKPRIPEYIGAGAYLFAIDVDGEISWDYLRR